MSTSNHNDRIFRNHTLRKDLQHVNDSATVYKCSGDIFELWESFWNREQPLDDFCKTISVERDGTITTDRVPIPSTFQALDIDTHPYFSSLPAAGIFIRPEYRKCIIYINAWLKNGGIEEVLEDVEKEVEYAMVGQEALATGDQLVVGEHSLDEPTDVMNSYGEEFANGIADRAFIVLGDSGIGKTMFLYYILIMRLINGLPTALQVDRTDYFHVFDATGVYAVSHDFPLEEYIPKGTWALVDGNISIPGTTNIFSQTHSPFFVVHACSPRPSLIEYAKGKAKQTPYFMLPFSWREILLCRSLIRPPRVPTEISISRWYDTFGPSARDCYNQTPHSGINHRCELSDLLSYVNWNTVVACLQNNLPQSPRSASLDESRSQDLFLVLPRYHNPFSPATVVITDYILNLFRVHYKQQFQLELRNMFELMYTHPHSRALLSHMFEDVVKLLLQKCVPRRVYSMKKGRKGMKNQVYHASEADRTWLFDLPPSSATFYYKNLDDVSPVPGLYLPQDSNEKTLDSFTVSEDTDGSVVLSYQQCTVGMKHGVHAEPLKTASAWIKAGKILKFHYIAVLPGVIGHHTAFYFPLKAFDYIEVSTGVIFIDPEEMSEGNR